MILIIDNYDSFAYNLYQMAGCVNPDVVLVKNDMCSVNEIENMKPSHIIISSGAGLPENTGICGEVIKKFGGMTPILGVGLGHQIICKTYGADIILSEKPVHGKKITIHIANGNAIFRGCPPVIEAAGYYSSSIKRESIHDDLLIIAEGENEEVMGVKHKKYETYGLQFNPESILTEKGFMLINNFLNIKGA